MLRFQGELILAMTYGYEVRERNDRMIDAAKRMTEFATKRFLPGALLVNQFPLRMQSLLFRSAIDFARSLQYATSLNGYHGSATSH
jgi:hypothetical protein